jgi:5-methylcytosine-specific restriction endonuclease McrA
MCKSLARMRAIAAHRQHFRCFYCGLPMWSNDVASFAAKYGLSRRLALQLQCTAEHLAPRSMGGTGSSANIVAACAFCNHKRHARPSAPDPAAYKQFVQQRVRRGRWLPASLPSTLRPRNLA